MFELETPLAELIARGVFLFLGFMFIFRVLPRRTGGELSPMDLVFLLLITESASHSLGEFSTLTDGAVQIGVFVGLNYMTNKLSYHFPVIRRLLEQKPLLVIKDGQIIPENLKKELLTEDELKGNLRMDGVDDVSAVKVAHVESDGRVSAVKK
ncbi:hypothetical protein ASD64_18405 [Mesorhizobium sp. Root157]|uniref:DUF421 domain-containing protein n=1 Tax=Mesorhizobium sp. Root157 TaxID=1736477 RepID=UPI0006FE25CB|nr:YetF domain-containing protein [Mesorhizobium sp. Root157]KQZ95878.1 hypothetical protein ASD64_18405 [Mesorhizobium sp. Root157]